MQKSIPTVKEYTCDMKNNFLTGVFAAMCTALFWGAQSPIAKIIAASGVSQVSVMCYRTIFGVATVGLWLLCVKGVGVFNVRRKLMLSYAAVGVLGIGCNATGFMLSCVYLSVPQALILHYTFPLVTMAGEAFVTKEKPSRLQVFAGFLVILGLYIGFFLKNGGMNGDISAEGIIWGTVSVFAISGQTLITRKISQTEKPDPIVQLFFAHLFAGIFLISLKSLLMGWSDLVFMTPRIFIIMHYPAIAGSLLGFGFLFTALKYIPASTVSMILTLEIAAALCLTPILLHKMPSLYEIAGCLIILAAVLCSIIGKAKAA